MRLTLIHFSLSPKGVQWAARLCVRQLSVNDEEVQCRLPREALRTVNLPEAGDVEGLRAFHAPACAPPDVGALLASLNERAGAAQTTCLIDVAPIYRFYHVRFY